MMHSETEAVKLNIRQQEGWCQLTGHRMEQSIAAGDAAPEQTIRYTLDLTRQYHNLLQKIENNVQQTYFWDGNVTGMEEEGREHFYFQDDLGSPMRLADEAGRSEETYGFDEFGHDIRTAKDMMPEWRKILMVTKNL